MQNVDPRQQPRQQPQPQPRQPQPPQPQPPQPPVHNQDLLDAQANLLFANLREAVIGEHRENRPPTTSTHYNVYVTQWTTWCNNHELFRGQPVPALVTPQKVLVWLNDNKDRPSRTNPDRVIGVQSYYSMVNAMVDLWKQQRERGFNNT